MRHIESLICACKACIKLKGGVSDTHVGQPKKYSEWCEHKNRITYRDDDGVPDGFHCVDCGITLGW